MTPREVCATHQKIALDSNVFIYLFEDPGRRGDLAGELVREAERQNTRLVASALAVMEAASGPARHDDEAMADRYAEEMRTLELLDLIPVNGEVAVDAAVYSARTGCGPFDGIHLATARLANASVLVTNDRRIRPVRFVDVVILDDLSLEAETEEGAPA